MLTHPFNKYKKFLLLDKNDSDYYIALFPSASIFLLWLGGIAHMKSTINVVTEESFVNKLNLDLNHAQLSTICKQGLHDFPPFPADQHPIVQPCPGKARVFIVSRP